MAGGVLGTPPEGFGEMLSIAIANSERLIRLVNDILDLERMESGRVGMAPTATDARSLVDQAVSVVRPVAEAAGVEIVHDVPEQPLHVDADRIVQVFTNLLDNAVKFSPPGSTVHVTAARDAGELRVAVRDQGRGIPADQLETVFERFSQVDASDSRLRGGTGLGLAICRRIVAEHGGRIWAESRPGDGATFVCSLPTELRRPPLGKSPPPSAR
jgi:signal transduction histidine kinase